MSVCGQIFGEDESSVSARPLDWPKTVTENRPGSYWWWPGSAVDRENITWNLETMREAGMGGGTIVPIYGTKGYEDRVLLPKSWLVCY